LARAEIPNLSGAPGVDGNQRLDSWKEIAAYLKRDVRTVQRWEKSEGLPVHRHLHNVRGSVYASTSELDLWWRTRRPASDAGSEFDVVRHQSAAASATCREKLKLVVLPFENLSANADQDYFSDGLTEEMISQLGRIEPARLAVVARTTAMHYKGTAKRIDQIARELGADYVLEGSVRRVGDRVRISAQLIEAAGQTHLWSQDYDRTAADVLEIQRDVAQQIAGALEIELLPAQQSALGSASTSNSAAYDAYLYGRYYWNRRTEEGFKKGMGYFQRAVEQDPGYAQAYAGLAECYVTLGWYGAFPSGEAYQATTAAANKALELDERMADAHSSLGYVKLLHNWDWADIEKEHLRALELDPNSVTGRHWYGLFLSAMGRSEEAVSQMRRALELDPLSLVVNTHLGWVHYLGRRFEPAIEHLEKARELDPNFPVGRYFLGLAYAQKGCLKEAIRELETSRTMTAGHPGWVATLGHIYGLAGKKAESRKCLRELEDMAKQRYVNAYFPAFTCAGLGETSRSLDWLEKAYEERSGWLVYLNVEPGLDGLRSSPRFAQLVRRVGLPQ
jgi:TolB-like protein/Flp pilus assembly protein TadD